MKKYINLVEQFTQQGEIPHLENEIGLKECSFAAKCLFGEYTEYKEAKEAKDDIEVLDAFLDICYFACSLAILFNLKKYCIDSKIEKVKPLKSVLGTIKAKNKNDLIWLLSNAYHSAKQEAEKIADFEGAFKEVHKTNMLKYTSNAPDAIIGAGLARNNKGLDAQYTKVKYYYYVFAWIDGYKRILKPYNWQEPQLKQFLK